MMMESRSAKYGNQRKNDAKGKIGFLLGALFVLIADQISKYLVLTRMELYETIPVIPGFFHLTYILNSGASFGMLQQKTLLFILLTSLVILFMIWAVFFWQGLDRPVRILLGLIAGGALGNLADRIRFGAVVDFVDFRGIWPYIFNVADVAVVCGGILLAIIYMYAEWQKSGGKPKH